MIEVKNLTRKYGEHTAVDSISFNIEDGRIYGFLGPNGAGKTTTMNIITGCLSATDGQVIINGHDIFDEPVKAKKCIGYLPEIPPLYTDMTVLEYLRFVGRAKGLKRAQISASIPDVVAKTGLSDVTNKLIKTLSKGYQQRVGIAQAILGDPQIVILDEPTVGLDPKQIVEIRSLIKELGQKHTVILSSHILSEVSEICDEIIIISAGKIVASDSAENLMGRFNSHVIIEITVKGDPDRAAEALAGLDEVLEIEIDDSLTGGMSKLFVKADSDIRAELADILVKNGIAYISMNVERANLEDIFLKLTDNGGEAFTAEEDAAYAGTEENEEEEGDE